MDILNKSATHWQHHKNMIFSLHCYILSITPICRWQGSFEKHFRIRNSMLNIYITFAFRADKKKVILQYIFTKTALLYMYENLHF